MPSWSELIASLALEPIELNLYRGASPGPEHGPRIYGGHVIAQALAAAYRTVDGRGCHSLQSYFIRPGDPHRPILYQVERSRDGGSFTTRRVLAIQNGEQIFNMACSFHVAEEGFEHQAPMPPAPPIEATEIEHERWRKMPEPYASQVAREFPFEVRAVDPINLMAPEVRPPQQQKWFRGKGPAADELWLQQALLAYVSDYAMISTAMLPHAASWLQAQSASLDHVIWFHRPSDIARWHLYDLESPSTSGSRGLALGRIYRDDGVLVASVAQEGLIRKPRK